MLPLSAQALVVANMRIRGTSELGQKVGKEEIIIIG